MTRGNQREKDRERAQARNKNAKGKEDGLTPEQRRERDAKALQEKQAKKRDNLVIVGILLIKEPLRSSLGWITDGVEVEMAISLTVCSWTVV